MATSSLLFRPSWCKRLPLRSPAYERSMGGRVRQACGCDRPPLARFSHDSNIFRTITTESVCPMQYFLLHTRVEGAPSGWSPRVTPLGRYLASMDAGSQPRLAVRREYEPARCPPSPHSHTE